MMQMPVMYAARFLGMGPMELVIILVVVLLIFGPRNLPKLGASLGRTVKNVRDGIEGKELDEGEIVNAEESVDDEEEYEEEEPAPKKKRARKSSSN
ncbi:MAG: twin-arginine translocase TatA/TatE family subunit [Actinomycetia bacterium]|nr:twin-arginine translocase TatA/TatE family subunit [Actinomycetes bacterium]